MPRDWPLRVQDMLDAIAKVQRYTSGLSFEAFCADEMRVDAVLRNIEIIGEAAGNVPSGLQARYPLPWSAIRGMRNIVAHAYFGVSLRIVWDTVHLNLPQFVPVLEQMLEEEADSHDDGNGESAAV